MSILIRPIRHEDYDQWHPLWLGYNQFYGRHGETALAEDITRTTWSRFFDPQEPVHALVADVDGRLAGLAHYLYHRSTTQLGLSCYLQDLYTDAALRGRGIARQLIEAVYAQARAAGSPRVYWQTHETNQTAMRLYDQVAEKSGFVVYRKML